MGKRTKPSGSRLLFGLVIGYLGGEQLLDLAKSQQGQIIFLGIVIALGISAGALIIKYPRGSYPREMYRYWVGQFGSWLTSLLIGGLLPLLRLFVYSEDFLTYVLLVPPLLLSFYLLLVGQQGFQMKRPVKAKLSGVGK